MSLKMLNIVKHTINKKENRIEGKYLDVYFDDLVFYEISSGILSPRIGERILSYKGYVKNGVFSGDGVLEFYAGDKYEGLFIDGIFQKGIHTTPSGKTYTGTFVDGNIKYGKFIVNKHGETYSEIYFYDINTNFIFLKTKINTLIKRFKSKKDYIKLQTFEMKEKKD